MKGLIRIRTLRALCVLLAVAGQASAILAQSGPPSKDEYIIVLKPPKSGVPELSEHDITAVGGKIKYKVPGRIQVILPAPAVEAMRKQERVKYIQKVILGPLPDASAPAELRMTPSTASLRTTTESTPPTWRSGTYKYDASGNIYAIGVAGDTGSPVQHRYAYDELSRLKQADTLTTPTHTETFTYDIYGNMTEHVDGSSTTSTPVEDPNTNRLAWSAAHPYTYDAAGNLTADYNATYAYDPFNMLREKDYTNEQPEYYIYTASDERIGVKYGTSSGSPTIWSIRDFSGNVLRQYEGHDQTPQMAWLWVEDYVYRDGQLLAAERVPEEGGRRHFHLDHLGSPRLVTGQDSKEMSEHDYAPFGLESNYQEMAAGFDREDPKRFTGHERDYAAPGESPASTAYLDYMHARFYNATVGRFLSVDPALDLKSSMADPQSWNRYAYTLDNPMGHTDPTGRDVSIAINFSGPGWTDEMKRAIIARVTLFYVSLNIGNAYVFDSARAKHSSIFALNARGYASITADATLKGGLHEPGLVRAGTFLQDTSLNNAQKATAIANTIDHETLAHQFGVTYDNMFDIVHYDRNLHFARQYPELSEYFGTVADSHIANDPVYRKRLFSGPLPIHPHDLSVAQQTLAPHRIDPPDPNQ